jgi:hypothetical protein
MSGTPSCSPWLRACCMRTLHLNEGDAAAAARAHLQQASVLAGGRVVAEAVGEKQVRVVDDALEESQGKECHVQGGCHSSGDEAGAGQHACAQST